MPARRTTDAVDRVLEAVQADDMRGLRDALLALVVALNKSASRYVRDALSFIRHRERVNMLEIRALEKRVAAIEQHLGMTDRVLEQLATATELLEQRVTLLEKQRERAIGN